MVLLVEVVFLRAAARKWITKAAKVPSKLPTMANSMLWVVYENAKPAMLIARREPRAKASFVAKSDRRRLGATIPAMNKVSATSISSRGSEKTFCLFMVFAFSFRTVFSKNPVCDRMDLAEQRMAAPHHSHGRTFPSNSTTA
jgi:hypothetical protein